MSKGVVFRVIIDGRGYDLINAFHRASARDWAALIGSTGHNPFLLGKRLKELEHLPTLSDDERFDLLAGPAGARLVDTVADLVFLARRLEGEREPDSDRPITPETSFASTPVMEALTGFAEALTRQRAAEAGEAEPDPTPARTVSDPGAGTRRKSQGKRSGRKT
jgi:hypothetical protein